MKNQSAISVVRPEIVPVGTVSQGAPTEAQVSAIFSSYMRGRSLFSNKDALTAQFVPPQILHRHAEAEHISLALAPLLKGYKPNNVFIYGTVGTGKTITARFVLRQLHKHAQQARQQLKIVYVNCKLRRVSDTEYRLLHQILKELGVTTPETGLATTALYRRFEEAAGHKTIVLVLDEIDALIQKIGDSFLYNLCRSDMPISIIGITNNLSFHDGLDARVKSSLGEEEVIFKPYNAQQLTDILSQRAPEAFAAEVDSGVIRKCAALAAHEHGDARRALELLRVAGELAERSGAPEIEESHVDAALKKIDTDRITEAIGGQPQQSKAALAAIMECTAVLGKPKNGHWQDCRVLSSDVYLKYKRLCQQAGLRNLTQRRVSDFINEFETLGIIETREISQGRYGRKREIKLLLSDEVTLKVQRVLAEAGL